MNETLDIFDCLFNPIGVAERKRVHQEGLWHQTFHCWIIRKRKDNFYVLFQKRSSNKSDSPNMLDIPAAGHLISGEQKEDGLRELKEELGINVNYDTLRYLGIRIEDIDVPGFNNKEFQHVYLLEDDTPMTNYLLQEDEVSGLVEVDLDQGLKLLYGEVESIECNSVFVYNGVIKKELYTLHLDDIIPRIDGYYKKIFIMAKRYFMGDKYLSI